MEKNLSIIQGLTATDQANPIRITDAGEVKTVVDSGYITVGGTVSVDPNEIVVRDQPVDNNPHINVPHYENLETGFYQPFTYIDNKTYPSGLTDRTTKLIVDQVKSFGTVLTNTYDVSGAPTADIDAAIQTHINSWTASYGSRYDDIIITPFTSYDGSTGIKYLMNITIIRYY